MATNRADLKANLRRRLRAQREERYVEHNLLHLLDVPEISSASVIASYSSYGTEPDTHALNQEFIAGGKTLLLPRINGEEIEWVQWEGSAQTVQEN
jgi:5-formyltetrahydrofolate cyclo-ligase